MARGLLVACGVLVGMVLGGLTGLYIADPGMLKQVVQSVWWWEVQDPGTSAKDRVFSPGGLRRFNGVDKPELYLAFLGKVYDVSTGEKHYGVYGKYRFFVGRDSTRAYLTGDFSDKGCIPSLDNMTLDSVEMEKIKQWREFFANHPTYKYKGKVVGPYFDRKGMPTQDYLDILRTIK